MTVVFPLYPTFGAALDPNWMLEVHRQTHVSRRESSISAANGVVAEVVRPISLRDPGRTLPCV